MHRVIYLRLIIISIVLVLEKNSKEKKELNRLWFYISLSWEGKNLLILLQIFDKLRELPTLVYLEELSLMERTNEKIKLLLSYKQDNKFFNFGVSI